VLEHRGYTPSIDDQQLSDLLTKVEAQLHLDGWHDHSVPWMYIAYDPHDVVTATALKESSPLAGEPVVNDRYVAHPILNPVIFFLSRVPGDESPAAGTYRFAMNVAYGDLDMMRTHSVPAADQMILFRKAIRMPGVLGFITYDEAFGLDDPTPEQANSITTGERHVWDHQNAKEMRVGVMVDALDRVHRVRRFRGEEPTVALDEPLYGDSVNSLRILMDSATGRLPPTPAEYAARYPRCSTDASRARDQ
jgi:hypothetical protein